MTFHNKDSGFCVLRMNACGQRDMVTVTAHAATIAAGEWVQISGIGPSRATRSAGIAAFMRSVIKDEGITDARREELFFERMRPLSLIRRLIEPREIAAQVAFLASPLGAVTNGAATRVEGGAESSLSAA